MRFLDYLAAEGYRRFLGSVDERVYVYFECQHPKKARWYVREEGGGRRSYQCAGCKLQCETDDPDGFQLELC